MFWNEYPEYIEKELNKSLPAVSSEERELVEAMRYSLLSGGKRIRASLTLAFCKIIKGSFEPAVPNACAIEMIHAYSLIHDDLPCMDDDDFRRGKPSCHKKYGEALALLAGDGLLTLAFETVLSAELLEDKAIRKSALELSRAAGIRGMIGGQVQDLAMECTAHDVTRLAAMQAKKTGALIASACVLGCIAAGAGEKEQKAALRFGQDLGRAFQIVDDILDVIGDGEMLGKPIGSDEQNQKTTYVSALGLEEAGKQAELFTNQAISDTIIFGERGKELSLFAQYLLERKK